MFYLLVQCPNGCLRVWTGPGPHPHKLTLTLSDGWLCSFATADKRLLNPWHTDYLFGGHKAFVEVRHCNKYWRRQQGRHLYEGLVQKNNKSYASN